MKTVEKRQLHKAFASLLIRWNNSENSRQMPWKGEKDPYKVWLSEIILQQTRVDQGLNYYHAFIERFPTVQSLAAAPDTTVFKLWEGLGYYTRCRNLLHTARYISHELQGRFPSGYEDIKALKGIGPYTAAAISSFAFNLPHAVVDGNVFRVLSRVFGINAPIDSNEGKKYFTALANEVLDKNQPGIYNQAIMDFGAVVCKPVAPLCMKCIFNKHCYAFRHEAINELPVKSKKLKPRKRFFYYLVMTHEGKSAIRQRTGKDIWSQLYEFPLIETTEETGEKAVLKNWEEQGLLKTRYEILSISPSFKQQLTHQHITGKFILVKMLKPDVANLVWVSRQEMKKYAFPRIINSYLQTIDETY